MGIASRKKQSRRKSSVVHHADGSRTIKLSDDAAAELTPIFKRQLAAFKEKFGREPGPDDPVFFDPESDVPVPYPLERYEREFSEMTDRLAHEHMDDLDFRAKIYATKKTGVFPTNDNVHLLPKGDWEEWCEAVREFKRNAQ